MKILCETDHYWLVYKPAGLLCHPTDLAEPVCETVLSVMENVYGQPVHLVHRLDRGTAGILLIAKSTVAATSLGKLFAQHKVQKTYQAICRGFTPEKERIDYPLQRENFFGSKKEKGRAQEAITDLVTLRTSCVPHRWERSDHLRYSLVEVAPLTGRTHQIRRHLAHLRHPIIGDTRHGDGKQNRMAREITQRQRLLLVATEIAFVDPWTAKPMHIGTEPDHEFLEIQKSLGLS